MKDDRSETVKESREEIESRVGDGGGCVETWSALSEMRSDDPDRRSFLRRLGLTLGAVPAFASAGSADPSGDGEKDEPKVTEFQGAKRRSLIEEALADESAQFVAEQFEGFPEAQTAFRYRVGKTKGYGVTFGVEGEDSPTIRYYRSEALDGGTKVLGGKPAGEGVHVVDGTNRLALDIATPTALEAVRSIRDQEEYANINADSEGELRESESVLVYTPGETSRRLLVPIERDGDIDGRLVATVDVEDKSLDSLRVSSVRGEDGVSIQGHVICEPTGNVCTDYCSILCGALAGLAGSACLAKCSATVAGIPIAPACSAVCAGVVAGTCYPTCKNHAH